MIRLALIITALAFLCACGEADRKRKFPEEKLKEEVVSTLKNYLKDINEKGTDVEEMYLDSSDGFFWVPPGFDSALDYDSVMAIIGEGDTNTPMTFNWEELKVQVMSPELAVYTGKVNLETVDSTGQPIGYRMIETGVLIRRMDGWKLYCGQTGMLE